MDPTNSLQVDDQRKLFFYEPKEKYIQMHIYQGGEVQRYCFVAIIIPITKTT